LIDNLKGVWGGIKGLFKKKGNRGVKSRP